MSEEGKPGSRVPGQCWDLVVRNREKKWKAGKGNIYKVSLSCDDPKIKLEIVSSSPDLFKIYPEERIFTISVLNQAQATLETSEEEEE